MTGSLHVNLFKCLIHSRYVNSFWSTTFFMKSPASSFKWRNSKINLRSSKDVFPWQKLTPTSYAVGVLGSETDLLRSSLTVQFLGLELPRNRNPPLIFAVNLVFFTQATVLRPLLGVVDHFPQLHGIHIQRVVWWCWCWWWWWCWWYNILIC